MWYCFAFGLLAFLAFLFWFGWSAPEFLSITRREAKADTLLVECWLSPDILPPVAAEFRAGGYARLIVAGQQNSTDVDPEAIAGSVKRTLETLQGLGVPRDALLPIPAPHSKFRRTAKAAEVVKKKLVDLRIAPKGINVITEGTHARESWTAYQNCFGGQPPVGIIAVPKWRFPPHAWWTTGLAPWVTKDFLGWLKEVVLPLRS